MLTDSTLANLSIAAYLADREAVQSLLNRPSLTFDQAITRNGTQALCAHTDDHVIVAFRGTEINRVEDWITDLKCACIRHDFGKVHSGFFGAYRAVSVLLRNYFREHQNKRVVLTGHSLGAALASLCAADLIRRPYHPLYEKPLLVTFGSPRVGNYGFSAVVSRACEVRRYVNNNDVVPKCPFVGYWHTTGLRYFDRFGELHTEPNYGFVLYDSLLGRIADIGKIGTAGIKDHSMLRYARLVRLHETANETVFDNATAATG